MAKFIITLDRLIYLYLCFVMGACLLSWVPNINPDYPLFHFIFTAAGFYILPPLMGIGLGPAVVMIACSSVSFGLGKLYEKFFAKKEQQIVVVTPEEFIKKLEEQKNSFTNKEQEETKKDDSI